MNIDRFAVILEAYGADPRRWPEAEREAAIALLRQDEAARRLMDDAGELDHALDAYRVRAPGAIIHERVLAAAPRGRSWVRFPGWARLWAPGAGLAAAGLAGLLVGAGLFQSDVSDAGAQALLAEAQAYDAALMLAAESEAL